MEPTLPTHPQIPDCETTLLHAYSNLARAQTHQQFVSTCLLSNTIPWKLRINTRPQVPSPPDEAILDHLSQHWAQILWWASTDMLVALKNYHRRCEQHLKQYISIEENKVVKSLGQSRSERIFEYVRTIYNHQKQGFEEKHQRKLNYLNILPSRQHKKQKERYKKIR